MSSDLVQNVQAHAQMVPGDFAEKAMASLMQLHSELMDEKERRVELYRKLMEREQAVAELRMYVKLLEEKVGTARAGSEKAEPQQPRPVEVRVAREPITAVEIPAARPTAPPTAHARAPEVAPPVPPRVARPRVDGWKTW